MTAAELGHVKDMIPGHSVGSAVYLFDREFSGRADQSVYIQTGCLIRHSTKRWGQKRAERF
jgi:hypothetical protein